MDKNTKQKLSGKYCQKLLDHAKKSATDVFKTSSKRVIQKMAEGTGNLIDNKIANKITKVSKDSQQNKDMYLQNKDKKLLMNWGYNNNVIME